MLDSQRTVGGTTTYVYRSVDITALAADADDDGTAEQVEVTADIPEATDYDHIHFGVWAALGEAEDDGTQNTLAELGIGFVHNVGDPMTANMPNHGDAIYDGNWVAAVQVADPDGNGVITVEDGVANLRADFVEDDITVNLVGLATLEGGIDGSGFSGTTATVASSNVHRLTGGADFTGEFNGAFFGIGAAEAGGVFDFRSEDNEAGAFLGAFGTRLTTEGEIID